MLAVALAAVAALPAHDAAAQTPPTAYAAALRDALRDAVDATPLPAERGPAARAASRAVLRAAYDDGAPLWLRDGRPTRQLHALVAAIDDVAARGLRPDDHDPAALRRAVAAVAAAATPDAASAARLDVAATIAALRLAAHLHAGRVDAREAGFALPDAHRRDDWAAVVVRLARADDVAAALRALEPPYAGYRALVDALAHQRALASTWRDAPPDVRGAVRPDDAFADAPALRRLLAALGDLPAVHAMDTTTRYDAPLVAAVRAFQDRHGLDPDGVLGPATAAALRVPPAARVRQIELTLERWRWLPDTAPARAIVVDVPAFRLRTLDGADGGASADAAAPRMRVVVGDADGHRTPSFVGEVREVVFRPYWDVPLSIAVAELLPRIRRDPAVLAREGFEIVRGGDHDAVTFAPTRANLARVASGSLRLRQRPGPRNALGDVKLVFPNAHNVYLHGTPAPELFARARRDFSHGCIRVEDPAALAAWVLAGQAPWDRAAVDAAMTDGPPSQRVAVAAPVVVHILYHTVVVDDDGRVRFLPDVYGHDAALDALLRRPHGGA